MNKIPGQNFIVSYRIATRNIQLKNADRKYNTYGNSVLQTAKLYNDAYSIDLFGNEITGCKIVGYDETAGYSANCSESERKCVV